MISYRAKNIVRGIIGKRGERKRARIFSIFAILAIVVLVSSLSVYGFNLKSGAEGNTNISATGAINNNYNFNYQGISIHTKAETLDAGGNPRGDATVKKGNSDIVQFTLTVSNADTTTKTTDVKFTLPTGFSYESMVSPATAPKKDSCAGASMIAKDVGVMYWCGYSAPANSDTTIVFKTNGPS